MSVTIPGRVTNTGSDAFYRCSSLNNVAISYGVDEIGYESFGDCTNLVNVTIPQ